MTARQLGAKGEGMVQVAWRDWVISHEDMVAIRQTVLDLEVYGLSSGPITAGLLRTLVGLLSAPESEGALSAADVGQRGAQDPARPVWLSAPAVPPEEMEEHQEAMQDATARSGVHEYERGPMPGVQEYLRRMNEEQERQRAAIHQRLMRSGSPGQREPQYVPPAEASHVQDDPPWVEVDKRLTVWLTELQRALDEDVHHKLIDLEDRQDTMGRTLERIERALRSISE